MAKPDKQQMDYLQHSGAALLCAHIVPSAALRASQLPAPQRSSVLQPASEPHHIAKEKHWQARITTASTRPFTLKSDNISAYLRDFE